MIAEESATIPAEGGVLLETRVSLSPLSSAGIVVCHPHPLYGGDMDNPVVVRVAEVAASIGLATLRFNFRGVGRSTGAHGGGEAEQTDITAALEHLRARLGSPAAPAVLAGYSFGAAVSARVAGRTKLAGLALIAPPLAFPGFERLDFLESVALPLLIVAGRDDEYCPLPILDRARAGLSRATVRVIDGANHFFFGTLFPLGETVREWLERLELGQA